jgi:hypothetical protein
MRKLMIVVGALAAVASLGAMRTASAENASPASASTTLPTARYPSTSVADARRHRGYATPRSTSTDRNARRDHDAGGSRATPYAVPPRAPDPRSGQWNSGYDSGRANDHQQAPSRVAGHGVRTPVHQASRSSHSSGDKNGRSRESGRGDRG